MDADVKAVLKCFRELHEIAQRRKWPVVAMQLANTSEGPMSQFILYTEPECQETFQAQYAGTLQDFQEAFLAVLHHQEESQKAQDASLAEQLIREAQGGR